METGTYMGTDTDGRNGRNGIRNGERGRPARAGLVSNMYKERRLHLEDESKYQNFYEGEGANYFCHL